MLDKPQITKTAARLTAAIHLTIPREEIQKVMGPGIGEIMAGLAAQGTTEVNRVYHIDRGYENIDGKLQALGARMERVTS